MIPRNRACWGFEIFVRSSKLYLLALGRVSGKVEVSGEFSLNIIHSCEEEPKKA